MRVLGESAFIMSGRERGWGVKVSIVRPLTNLRFPKEVSDWSIVIISTLPNSLSRSSISGLLGSIVMVE